MSRGIALRTCAAALAWLGHQGPHALVVLVATGVLFPALLPPYRRDAAAARAARTAREA